MMAAFLKASECTALEPLLPKAFLAFGDNSPIQIVSVPLHGYPNALRLLALQRSWSR
jgi:hypothetical protein